MSYLATLNFGVHKIPDFVFQSGFCLPELTLAYRTLGNRRNPAVLLLHGTLGTGQDFLKEAFAGEMFDTGYPLDVEKWYIIMPDSIGLGGSSKPSDGLKASFPQYNYYDMVSLQHKLVTDGLGVTHLKIIIGNSMGGMHAWMWGYIFPNFMDILVPLASTPAAMSGRNWMMRRFLIDSIRRDPTWMEGNYVDQPKGMSFAYAYFNVAMNGGLHRIQKLAPSVGSADKLMDSLLAAELDADANDHLFRWEASRDYDPWNNLPIITAAVLAIVSADDERNPLELGLIQTAMERVQRGELFVIPASEETQGHSTTSQSRKWREVFCQFLHKF